MEIECMNLILFLTLYAFLTIVTDTVGMDKADVKEKHFSVLILVL